MIDPNKFFFFIVCLYPVGGISKDSDGVIFYVGLLYARQGGTSGIVSLVEN